MSRSTIHLSVDSGPKQGETLVRKPGSLIRVGRVVKGNTLAIKDSSISQKHLAIEFDPQACRWILRDLDTSNGTFVNGDRVPPSAAVSLSDGDTVKIGECTYISVKISVVEENVDGVVRGKRVRGRSRSVGDDCREVGVRDCERVSAKDEILDSVVEDVSEDVPRDLKKGRKLSSSGDLSKDEILGSALDGGTEAKNLGRRKRTRSTVIEVAESKSGYVEETKDRNCESVSTNGEMLNSVAEGGMKEVPMTLGRARKRNSARCSKKDEVLEPARDYRIDSLENVERVEERNSCGVSSKDEGSENAVEDRMKALENLRRGRKGKAAKVSKTDEIAEDNVEVLKKLGRGRSAKEIRERCSKKDEVLEPARDYRIDSLENLERVEERNSCGVSSKDEGSENAVEDRVKALENLRRGRRGKAAKVSKTDEIAEDNVEVPKKLGRGRRTKSSQILEKDSLLNPIVEDGTEQPESSGKQRGKISASVLMDNENSEPAVEDLIEVPRNLRRGRRANLVLDAKKDKVLEGGTDISKTVGKHKKTTSTRVLQKDGNLDLAAEDNVQVPKNAGRGRRINSSRVSRLDENLDSVVEDRTDAPEKLERGKRRTNTSRVSKIDEMLDAVQGDAVVLKKNISEGKPERTAARRTRASSRVLKPAENLYQSKELEEGTCQLSQLDKIQKVSVVSSPPADSKDKRSRNREDKENYFSVKHQKTESETKKTGNSVCKGIPEEERPASACTATENQEPLLVVPKVWNGNGIPNTTTKYKEDQKVSWHATPFEERLEKALSDDKLFPQRKLTN